VWAIISAADGAWCAAEILQHHLSEQGGDAQSWAATASDAAAGVIERG
jgi:hypothetical protein